MYVTIFPPKNSPKTIGSTSLLPFSRCSEDGLVEELAAGFRALERDGGALAAVLVGPYRKNRRVFHGFSWFLVFLRDLPDFSKGFI